MSRRFVRHYEVRFGEIDHARVMYYPALFDRMHRGFEDFWAEAANRTYAQVLNGDNLGFPLIHIESDFRKPFRFGESLRMEIDVVRLGTRSITMRFRLGCGDDPEFRAEAKMVLAVIDLESFKPCDLPASYRGYLEAYLAAPEPAVGVA